MSLSLSGSDPTTYHFLNQHICRTIRHYDAGETISVNDDNFIDFNKSLSTGKSNVYRQIKCSQELAYETLCAESDNLNWRRVFGDREIHIAANTVSPAHRHLFSHTPQCRSDFT